MEWSNKLTKMGNIFGALDRINKTLVDLTDIHVFFEGIIQALKDTNSTIRSVDNTLAAINKTLANVEVLSEHDIDLPKELVVRDDGYTSIIPDGGYYTQTHLMFMLVKLLHGARSDINEAIETTLEQNVVEVLRTENALQAKEIRDLKNELDELRKKQGKESEDSDEDISSGEYPF